MVNQLVYFLGVLSIMAIGTPADAAQFSYSGSLASGTTPLNGLYDFQFGLYESATAESQIGTTISLSTAVEDGAFNVQLDFGDNAFKGTTRWLQMAVKRAEESAYTLLSPLTAIPPVPHAQFAVASDFATTTALAERATLADFATSAANVALADSATSAAFAENAALAEEATSASYSQNAFMATLATSATHALNATVADFAFSAAHATTAENISSIMGQPITEYATRRYVPTTGTVTAIPNNRYFASEPGETTITLPSDPEVGDVFEFLSHKDRGTLSIAVPEGFSFVNMKYPTKAEHSEEFTYIPPDSIWSSRFVGSDNDSIIIGYSQGGVSPTVMSTDGGIVWNEIAAPTQSDRSVSMTPDGTTILLAARSPFPPLWISKDSGSSWETTAPLSVIAQTCCSSNGQVMYAYSGSSALVVSEDAGASWIEKSRTGNRLLACSPDGNQVIIEDFSNLYISTNKGTDWTQRPLPFSISSASITTSRYGDIMYGIGGGKLYRSKDYGISWVEIRSVTTPYPEFVSADGSIIGCSKEASFDEGATWKTCMINPAPEAGRAYYLSEEYNRLIVYTKTYYSPADILFEPIPFPTNGDIDWSNYFLSMRRYKIKNPLHRGQIIYAGKGEYVVTGGQNEYDIVHKDGTWGAYLH